MTMGSPPKRKKWQRSARSASSGPAGILADFWQKILIEEDMQPHIWNQNMGDYIRNEESLTGRSMTRVDRTSMRGNLAKALTRPYMTWRVFFKGLKWLKWRRFQIIIIGEQSDRIFVQHTSRVVTLVATNRNDSEVSRPFPIPTYPGGLNPVSSTDQSADSEQTKPESSTN